MKREPGAVQSSYLFPAIVILLVTQPVLATLSATASEFLVLPLGVTLVMGIWSLDRVGIWFRASLGVSVVMLAAMAAHTVIPSRAPNAIAIACLTMLSVSCVVLGARWLFTSPRITIDSLLAAVSVYLQIGITFGIIYTGLYALRPAWYHGVSPGGRSAEAAELFYFSIGTLTTVAYGDVLPVHPVTRMLCNIEAVIGQMYMAVLVAMLVGGYAADRMRSNR